MSEQQEERETMSERSSEDLADLDVPTKQSEQVRGGAEDEAHKEWIQIDS